MINDIRILYTKVFSTPTMKKIFLLLAIMTLSTLVAQWIKEKEVETKSEIPEQSYVFPEFGFASYYANFFEGRLTASGEIFQQRKISAAHPTLPFGTKVKVTNIENQLSVDVIINDRGPYVPNRIIDLSKAAFYQISDLKHGLVFVKIERANEEVFP